MRSRHFATRLLLPACLLALSSLASVSVEAQVTAFNDRTAFTAATSGLTLIDFNDQVTAPNTFTNYAGGTVTLSGVTFTANNLLFAVSPSFNAAYDLGDGTVLSYQGASPDTLTIALPTNTTAVGFDFGSFSSDLFTFTLSTGDIYTLTGSATPTNTPTFAGFTSAVALTSLTISNSTDTAPQIDRFEFGTSTPAAVPEPGSIALLTGMTLTGAAFLRRRKQASKAA